MCGYCIWHIQCYLLLISSSTFIPYRHIRLSPCNFGSHMPKQLPLNFHEEASTRSFLLSKDHEKWVIVTQSCLTLCDPMHCSLPVSSVHGILQARPLEWVAMPFSRGFSQPRVWTWVSRITDRCFIVWATREAPKNHEWTPILLSISFKCELMPMNA